MILAKRFLTLINFNTKRAGLFGFYGRHATDGGARNKKTGRDKLGASAELSDGEDSEDEYLTASEEDNSASEDDGQNSEDSATEDEQYLDTVVENQDMTLDTSDLTASEEDNSASEDDGQNSEDSATEDEQYLDTVVENQDMTLDTSGVDEVETDVGSFLAQPTVHNLNRLGANAVEVIDAHLQAIKDPADLIQAYVDATFCVAGLSEQSPKAAQLADLMYPMLIKRAGQQHAATWILANTMLIALGLIKVWRADWQQTRAMFDDTAAHAHVDTPTATESEDLASEDKNRRIHCSLGPCYRTLARCIDAPFFPGALRDTLRFFASSKKTTLPHAADLCRLNMSDECEILNLVLHFAGGAELLFDKMKTREIELPSLKYFLPDCKKEKWTMRELLMWIKAHLLKDRLDLFMQGDSVRPGILVLINDKDWELYGELDYVLEHQDTIMFKSTLHGG